MGVSHLTFLAFLVSTMKTRRTAHTYLYISKPLLLVWFYHQFNGKYYYYYYYWLRGIGLLRRLYFSSIVWYGKNLLISLFMRTCKIFVIVHRKIWFCSVRNSYFGWHGEELWSVCLNCLKFRFIIRCDEMRWKESCIKSTY